jgi:hypothetical protein
MPRPQLATPVAHPDDPSKNKRFRNTDISWRECPLLPLSTASVVAGPSITSLYRLEAEGKLQFKRLAGRTFVVTRSLIALVNNAEDWTPSDRPKVAHAKRAEIAHGNARRSA